MLIIDPIAKIITNKGKTYAHSKNLPLLVKEYADEFTAATANNSKFNRVRAYICYNIETAISYTRILYNDDGDKNILPHFRKNNKWLKWNKLSSHREA